jgi:NADPH2:quinone reductase
MQDFKFIDFIVDFVSIDMYWDAVVELIKPQGHIASITGSATPVALNKLKTKSASFSWEYMYTRPVFSDRRYDRTTSYSQYSCRPLK